MVAKEYSVLWNTITDAINELEELTKKLKAAQCQAEGIVLNSNDN